VITPSKQQLRHREVSWGGSWTAKLCTEEHEAHMRHDEVGKPAPCGKARHCQQRRHVDATEVERKSLLLFGETCTGAAGNSSGHHREVMADRAGVSRGHITGRGSDRREGPNVKRDQISDALASVPVIAAKPLTWALLGKKR